MYIIGFGVHGLVDVAIEERCGRSQCSLVRLQLGLGRSFRRGIVRFNRLTILFAVRERDTQVVERERDSRTIIG